MFYYAVYGVAQLVEALLYKPEGRWFDSRWCNWKIFIDHYHFQVPIVSKYGSFNLLETSGPIQACNGNALLYMMHDRNINHTTVKHILWENRYSVVGLVKTIILK